MFRLGLAGLVLLLITLSTPACATPPVAASGPDARYLYQCGYLLLRCSGINLIRGLGLDRRQLLALREIAVMIDAVVPPPVIRENRDPRWGPLLGTFLRLERALRAGREIPEVFREEVLKARLEESAMINAGLRFDRAATPMSCGRCHGETDDPRWGRIPWLGPVAHHPGIRREQGMSHALAAYGITGYILVAWNANRVDAILRNPQKHLVSSFSCCLLPTKDMADPVRIGQAEEGDWEAPLLDRLRQASGVTLPFLRFAAKRFLMKRQRVLHPGQTKPDADAVRARIDTVIDEARALSEVDYALQRHELAVRLRGDEEHPLLTAAAKRFKTAMFLLIPGSTGVYDEVLRETPE